MKKRIMKFLAGFLAMTMALAPSIVSNAADPVTITVEGEGTEYQAYKLMSLTTSLKADCGHADGEAHADSCYNYSYTLNETYKGIMKTAAYKADPSLAQITDDAHLIQLVNGFDADQTRSFADAVYAGIKDMTADFTSVGKIITADGQGYYLIAESAMAGDPDAKSLVMLDTAGQNNITVKSKESVPTLTKKIRISGDEEWVDSVVVQAGDVVEFKLEGTVPENILSYKQYKYVIHDVMEDGFAFTNMVSMTVDGKNKQAGIFADGVIPQGMGNPISNTNGAHTGTITDSCTMEFGFDDLIKAMTPLTVPNPGPSLTKDSKVEVIYRAKALRSVRYNAIRDMAAGNPGEANMAHLEFSNDPYEGDSSNPGTSSTRADVVRAFTLDVAINKTDKDGAPLAGSAFMLYKNTGTAESPTWTPAPSEYQMEDRAGAARVAAGIPVKNEAGTSFVFHGLSQGSYKLVETTIPDGYNKADDVYFDIEAVCDAESDDPRLTSVVVKQDGNVVSEGENASFTISTDLGTMTGSVINLSGTKLPSTGELGRAILLYGGMGAVILALAAVVVAGRKKNSSKPRL